MKPIFFRNTKELRDWFEKYHEQKKELLAGYYKRATGKESITWSESVDAALCFGWIDGIRKSIDEEKYVIRFTPRNPKSNWSAINIKKVEELKKLGLMKPAGLAVYEQKDMKKVERYSYERTRIELDEKYLKLFKKNKKAWDYYYEQAPSYKKICALWVMSAKREETRLKRLEIVISSSANSERIPLLKR